ncbi:serine/threonine-protein phosphatase 2A 65 kDa regulatory subunit A alpha isoform-like [Zophobas morio]|uniref:serine/threonine-protein phosphatase 2A 65 kDa regulatory subunit A alpha isoform-like n=1 Tax=Zophobas morio TaxID=2755281 RepID=UPI003083E37C
MVDSQSSYEIGVFKDALMDDNISVQVDAIKRLPSLAAAMDAERTREELIPCLVNCVDAMPEESCFNLAEQLERLVPFVGGNDHVGILLDILVKLACEDEVIVRDKAVESMKKICEVLDNEQCENSFYSAIERMIKSDWFTTKCSAGCLIAICYAKMSLEKQTELRNYFRNLIQDEAPMVRRSTATSLVEFIPLINVEEIISEFVPIFDNLAQDEQDSVRTLAVDVGVAISKRLKDFEVYEYLLRTFKTLSEDSSWRVRQRVAWKIHEIQTTEKNRDEIINIYSKCVRDDESEVRVFAAKNVYNLAINLMDSYKNEQNEFQDIFEKNFEENIIPEVHLLLRDPSDDVRVALSTNILSLSAILRNECFNANILPLVIDALENEEFMPFKENMLKNLSSLPTDVDITKSLKSIKSVIQNLIENSQMHWRTRRNLLLAFMHITRNTTSEFFDQNLKFFYRLLLNDNIYAIRRTAPVILPLLVKQFGTDWAINSLVPIFVPFSTDQRYMFRYITLFAIEELISPTLDCQRDIDEKQGKYLVDFTELKSKQAVETLVKIVKLNQKLTEELSDEEEIDEDISITDNLNFYAEDTLDNLRKEQQTTIFSVSPENLEDCYLEGVLVMLVKDFLKVIKDLMDDPIKNVQERARVTLSAVRNFCFDVKTESDQIWVQESMKLMSDDDLKRIEDELEEKLKDEKPEEEYEMIDCDMDAVEDAEDTEPPDNNNTTENSDDNID